MDPQAIMKTLAELPALALNDDIPILIGALEQCKTALFGRFVSRPVDRECSSRAPQGLLTIPEVACRLGLPKGRVYELARQGRLPTVRIGKYVRVDAGGLQEWITQQRS
jgi:excisionase family DNA binding protein